MQEKFGISAGNRPEDNKQNIIDSDNSTDNDSIDTDSNDDDDNDDDDDDDDEGDRSPFGNHG